MKTDNKNISENLLIAYLYGEVTDAEKQEVEQYFNAHPEARAEISALQEVRKRLSAIPEKEVIIPALFPESQQNASHTQLFKTLLAIAASIALILVSGWLTGTQINWTGDELRISFGNKQEHAPETQLTTEQVQSMIEKALRENIVSAGETTLNEQQIREWIKTTVATMPKPTQPMINNEQLRQFTEALYAENARLMREFIHLSAREQQQAIEEMLIDFTQYISRQRQNDLQSLYARLNALEQNTELYKQETDQLLTGIMASVAVPVREIKN